MRRRIWFVGTALIVGSLVVGAAAATAASTRTSTTKVTKVRCATSVTITAVPGSTDVVPPVSQGIEYGAAQCGNLLGSGVQGDSFTVPASGDVLAKYTMYFLTGTIRGKYDLVPQEGSFGNFGKEDYAGTLTVTGGTGTFAGMKGKGTMTCVTPDGVHTKCTDHLKLT